MCVCERERERDRDRDRDRDREGEGEGGREGGADIAKRCLHWYSEFEVEEFLDISCFWKE